MEKKYHMKERSINVIIGELKQRVMAKAAKLK